MFIKAPFTGLFSFCPFSAAVRFRAVLSLRYLPSVVLCRNIISALLSAIYIDGMIAPDFKPFFLKKSRNSSGVFTAFLTLFIPAVFLSALAIALFLYADMQHRIDLEKRQESASVSSAYDGISMELNIVFQSILNALNRGSLKEYAAVPSSENFARLVSDMYSFALDNNQFDQIRMLDPAGMELLRINRSDSGPVLVPEENLADKSRRYYYKDIMELAPDNIYISRLDLNIENGVVEVPYKPIIRIGTKLLDRSGKLLGIMVFNYLADNMLNGAWMLRSSDQGVLMLLDHEGYWLQSDTPSQHWGFMFGDTLGINFAQRHPGVWQQMLQTGSGQIATSDGVFTYAAVAASPAGHTIYSYKQIHVPDKYLRDWFIVSYMPFPSMTEFLWAEGLPYSMAFFLVCLLSMVGTFMRAGFLQERKEAVLALRKSEERFRGIVETSHDWIWEMDLSGWITYSSPRIREILGYSVEEAYGKRIFDLMSYNDARTAWGHFMKAVENAAAVEHHENAFQHKAGLRVVLESNMVPMEGDSGELLGFRGIARDVTEKKIVLSQLETARKEAENASRAKGEFLARMSHEIRTPMNAVIGMCHLALKTALTPKQFDYLTKIQSSANSLLGVINDVLDFSKIEAGKLDMERVRFNLETTLTNVASVNSIAASDNGLEFLLDMGKDVPLDLVGDPLRLGQVLTNLVSNAIKFTSSGEVIVSVKLVKGSGEKSRIRFAVKDSGIGISSSDLAKLFNPFSQADGSITRKYGGTGLGLSISNKLVQLMGGEMHVESEPGRGSIFSFELEFERHRTDSAAEHLSFTGLEGTRVLVADDNFTSRAILKEVLESLRFDVTLAESGEEAVDLVQKTAEPFKVVLLDWRMPGLDGLACARHIRQLDLPVRPTILIITAYGREEVLGEIPSEIIDGVLLKPVARSLLLNTILDALPEYSSRPEQESRIIQIDTAQLRQELADTSVLVVEDNKINRQIAKELLEGVGVRVTLAGDGLEALALVENYDFDLIFMDIQMPRMDGLEACRRIRQLQHKKQPPVVAMTAHALAGDRETSLRAGMNDHITKPIDPDELYAALANWIKRNHAPEGADGIASSAEMELPQPDDAGDDADQPYSSRYADAPLLDFESGLKRIKGNRKLYNGLLREFADEFATYPQTIRQYIGQDMPDEARRVNHALRGVAGNIGAKRLYNISIEISDCLKEQLLECAPLVTELGSSMLMTLREIEHYLETLEAEHAPESGHVSSEGLAEQVEKLRALLKVHDTRALESVEGLKSVLQGSQPDIYDDLVRALNKFDFKAALKLLDRIHLQTEENGMVQ
jgi:PAS domain S-box-containing protein